MADVAEFTNISPTTLADVLGREQVMDVGIRPLWDSAPRVAGPAFTVRCPAGDVDYAVAGGNVCAVAQRRGIAAFVVDGVIRDLGEVREMGFPVFARGVIPFAGSKTAVEPLNAPIRCGGVKVSGGDIVVADEEGVVVTPSARQDQALRDAQKSRTTTPRNPSMRGSRPIGRGSTPSSPRAASKTDRDERTSPCPMRDRRVTTGNPQFTTSGLLSLVVSISSTLGPGTPTRPPGASRRHTSAIWQRSRWSRSALPAGTDLSRRWVSPLRR